VSELHREVLYRALGVPDILLPENKQKAAAAKLARQLPLPEAVNRTAPLQAGLQDEAALVLEAFSALFEAGDLDPLLGDYTLSTQDAFARQVANKACQTGDYQWHEGIVAMSNIVVATVCSYVANHPHGEPESPV
jgi:hypothetical protein